MGPILFQADRLAPVHLEGLDHDHSDQDPHHLMKDSEIMAIDLFQITGPDQLDLLQHQYFPPLQDLQRYLDQDPIMLSPVAPDLMLLQGKILEVVDSVLWMEIVWAMEMDQPAVPVLVVEMDQLVVQDLGMLEDPELAAAMDLLEGLEIMDLLDDPVIVDLLTGLDSVVVTVPSDLDLEVAVDQLADPELVAETDPLADLDLVVEMVLLEDQDSVVVTVLQKDQDSMVEMDRQEDLDLVVETDLLEGPDSVVEADLLVDLDLVVETDYQDGQDHLRIKGVEENLAGFKAANLLLLQVLIVSHQSHALVQNVRLF